MVDYHAYIRSPAWSVRREQLLEAVGRCCEFCGSETYRLHVHHLTYERLGAERDEDLAVLCSSCHDDLHEYGKIGASVESLVARRSRFRREEVYE